MLPLRFHPILNIDAAPGWYMNHVVKPAGACAFLPRSVRSTLTRHDSDNHRAHNRLAFALTQQGKQDEAIVAAKNPKRLAQMVGHWQKMAEEVLVVSKRHRVPVATEVTGHQHPEWSNFDRDPAKNPKRKKK